MIGRGSLRAEWCFSISPSQFLTHKVCADRA